MDSTSAKDALRYLLKRLNHTNPHVVLHTLTLLDACVNNCGKRFHLEVCSREFETEFKKVLNRTTQTKVAEKMLILIKKWAESKEFKDDPQLTLVPTMYRQLKEKYRFPSSTGTDGPSKAPAQLPSDPNVVTSNQEEEDIAKAIALSLKDSTPKASSGSPFKTMSSSNSTTSSSVYPSFDTEPLYANSSLTGSQVKEPYQVRALYDFEAAEDNELTLKAGEVVVVVDDSHQSWWKGSNHRGEGLFPSNFVTTDLSEPEANSKGRKGVQFNDEVKVKVMESVEPVTIDEDKMDRLLHLLHEADPTGETPDSEELLTLEEQCAQMGPLIDEDLEKVDRRLASLNTVNVNLVKAMETYHSLMKESVLAGGTPQYAYQSPYQHGIPQQIAPHPGHTQIPPPSIHHQQPPYQPPPNQPSVHYPVPPPPIHQQQIPPEQQQHQQPYHYANGSSYVYGPPAPPPGDYQQTVASQHPQTSPPHGPIGGIHHPPPGTYSSSTPAAENSM